MENKTTDDLSQALMSEPDLDSYLRENQPFFAGQSIAELLALYHERTNLSKAALARKAGMSEVYLHTRSLPDGGIRHGTACSVCAWAWRPLWRRLSGCSSWPAMLRSIPDSNGTPSSAMASCTTWPWGRSTTNCSPRTKKPCIELLEVLKIKEKEREQ